MSYCRHCGTEITFTRTANNKWMPYDVTGQPHFCQENNENKNKKNGLKVCTSCGKPIFMMGRKKIDYSSLETHSCKKADITRYKKYLDKHK